MMSNHVVFEKGAQAQASNFGDLPEWDLSDLYSSFTSDELDRDLKTLDVISGSLAKDFEGKVVDLARDRNGDAAIADLLRRYEVISDLMGRIGSYAQLLFAKDSTDLECAKFYGDIQARLTEVQSRLIFVTLELNALEEQDLEMLYRQSDEIARLRPWMEDNRCHKPFQLAPAVERMLSEKSVTSRQAWVRLFDESMGGLTAEFDGEEMPLQQVYDILSDADAKKRAGAADVINKTLAENVDHFSRITNVLAKDLSIEASARNYPDLATERHLSNQIEAPIVEALVDSVRGAYPDLSHRYYKLKAKWLGVEALNFWDRAAPMPEADDAEIGWNEAKDIVLSAYGQFSPDLAALAEPFFEKGWIDAPVTPGKSAGAFSHPTVPSAHPYILVNYMGKTRDVMTLAHELGHGVHQVLAAAQGPLLADTPLTLAETASVFGEMLTFQSLKKSVKSDEAKKALIASKVEDMLNTVVRQICFYDFERRLHTARKGGELTPQDIGEIWIEVQKESLGPHILCNEGFENYWSYIPHFIHVPFYVYAYAFGDCLVNSLFAVYQTEGDAFKDKYFDLLKAGGTLRHKELLAPFGLDASEPNFWNKGLAMISGLIDELEAL